MLIPFHEILSYMTTTVRGILHIGAHDCEEREEYQKVLQIGDDKVIWIEALPEKIASIRQQYPSVRVLEACISNEDDCTTKFTVTNNYQSSSMLKLKEHLIEHPWVQPMEDRTMKTVTLTTLLNTHHIDPIYYNFINLDIQGAELKALQGASDILKYVDYIYCEVNDKEMYEDCALTSQIDQFLSTHGFERKAKKMTIHGWGDAFYTKKNEW